MVTRETARGADNLGPAWPHTLSPIDDLSIHSAAAQFFCDLETLRQEILSQRELRETPHVEPVENPAGSIDSFHGDPRYKGDRHRADMAWAPLAAHHGLSQRQIEIEIFRTRDLSK